MQVSDGIKTLNVKLGYGTVVYFLFIGAGSLLPLYLHSAHYSGVGIFDAPLLATGDLLLISIVLVVGSIGDLVYTFVVCKKVTTVPGWMLLTMIAGQIGVLLISVQRYMQATQPEGPGVIYGELHQVAVAHGSHWMYGLAVAVGWSTLLLRLAEEDSL